MPLVFVMHSPETISVDPRLQAADAIRFVVKKYNKEDNYFFLTIYRRNLNFVHQESQIWHRPDAHYFRVEIVP
jgi:hypothetical protein